jgi:RNA polymerase sigma-70 factor (ECF subfamily)
MDADDVIYDDVKDDLVRYAAVLVGASDAEDVLSEVVVNTLRLHRLHQLRDPRAYLFRSVLNEARTRARAAARRTTLLLSEPTDELGSTYDDEIAAAVMSLPVRQRAAIFLVYWEDLSIGDAAKAMGARPGTVKRYLHLARKSLRETLQWTTTP